MDEGGRKTSGPVARKATLFRRAVLEARRREQSSPRGTDAAARSGGNAQRTNNGVKDQQMRIKAAFGGADAA